MTVRWRTYMLTSLAAATAAAVGARAVDPDSSWYRGLAKPSWQPPPRVFGLVWTPLYASIAWAAGHALQRAADHQRSALMASLAANLTLNTAWNWMFFGLRSPRAGLAGTVLLDLSNAELIRRIAQIDPEAAAALVPYAAWCAFATMLNADIARRNTEGAWPGPAGLHRWRRARGRSSKEAMMPRAQIKEEKTYQELRRKGESKEKSARIANATAGNSRSRVGRKGGKSGSYDDWSKQDLVQRAREIGIKGRSTMTKAELIEALRNH